MANRRDTTVALVCLGVIGGMVGLTAASVPLYRLFCQVTGYGGTTQRAETAPTNQSDVEVEVFFNADTASDMPWEFAPEQRSVKVKLGEEKLVFYRAKNLTDRPIAGQATFNVTPFSAGPYFNKLQCFCFDEQTLQPGQEVDMPVTFYVDPALLTDPDGADTRQITLSYTFFLNEEDTKKLSNRGVDTGPGAPRPAQVTAPAG